MLLKLLSHQLQLHIQQSCLLTYIQRRPLLKPGLSFPVSMAQRGNAGNKPAQRTSITAKTAGILPGHATGANKSTAASKPQPASTSLPASAPGTAVPSPSPATAAAAVSAPAQPKTPAKHASPPAKPPDPLQKILMTAAAKGLSAASTNPSTATHVQRPKPGRGQGVVAAADDDPQNTLQR